MKIVKELLKQGRDGVLDNGQVHRMLHQYVADRANASCVRWRTEEGGKARMFANDLETKLKPVIRALSLIGNMTTYPCRVANRVATTEDGSDKVMRGVIVHNAKEYYDWLIAELGEEDGK
jgi:hypothetical protein